VILALGWIFMPGFVELLAPGFSADPEKFALAVSLTRITFPYLFCITLVTMHTATLNAHGQFAVGAFAPVLLNVVTMGFLAVAYMFPNAAYAAATGIVASGVAQLALLMAFARRRGLLEKIVRPRLGKDVRAFFRMFGPAVIGSSGLQIAMFADTIIGSLLQTGGMSSLYYAERLYQLPIGLVGVAAGTVLLPEMSRFWAAGDDAGAFHAQNRTMALSIMLSAPFFVAFIMIPEWIMQAVFHHGKFTGDAADASAAVLEAYGFGLLAVVLMRSAVASFQAKGDTTTPMIVTLVSYALNIGLKIVLFQPFGAAGLAAATAAGYWLNFGLLVFLAIRRGDMKPDAFLGKTGASVSIASFVLAFFALLTPGWFWAACGFFGRFQVEATFLVLGTSGALVYGGVLIAALKYYGINVPLPRRFRGGTK
jgi:putative peptidoglycan lipid II flippase